MLELWQKAKRWVIGGALGLALLASAYAAGRYSAPDRVVTKTEVVRASASMEATEWGSAVRERITEGPVRIVTHTIDRPAAPAGPGCVPCPAIHETTVTEERGPVVTDRSGESSGAAVAAAQTTDSTSMSKEVTRERARFALEGGAQGPVKALKLDRVEAAGSVRAAGPFWLTVGASSDPKKLGDAEQYRWTARLRVEF